MARDEAGREQYWRELEAVAEPKILAAESMKVDTTRLGRSTIRMQELVEALAETRRALGDAAHRLQKAKDASAWPEEGTFDHGNDEYPPVTLHRTLGYIASILAPAEVAIGHALSYAEEAARSAEAERYHKVLDRATAAGRATAIAETIRERRGTQR